MKYIYLDQMAWIELARAKFGKTDEQRSLDAYLVAKEAARRGRARFVLSGTNHYETQLRSSFDSRLDVVDVMAELSKFHVIRRPQYIVPTEVQSAICELMGVPYTAKPLPFGIGISAMWNYEFEDMSSQLLSLDNGDCKELGLTPRLLDLFAAYPEHANDILLLTGRDRSQFDQDNEIITKLRSLDQSYVDHQLQIESEIASNGALRAEIKNVVAGAALGELKEEIIRGCFKLNIRPELLTQELAGEASRYMRLLRLIKSRWVAYNMELQVHRQVDRQWTRGDLHDVIGLSVAIPYCDIVVTEKQWCHLAQSEKLDLEYGTRVVPLASMLKELSTL